MVYFRACLTNSRTDVTELIADADATCILVTTNNLHLLVSIRLYDITSLKVVDIAVSSGPSTVLVIYAANQTPTNAPILKVTRNASLEDISKIMTCKCILSIE